jgi:hypothetical protein
MRLKNKSRLEDMASLENKKPRQKAGLMISAGPADQAALMP